MPKFVKKTAAIDDILKNGENGRNLHLFIFSLFFNNKINSFFG